MSIFKRQHQAAQPPNFNALNLQKSTLGVAIPLVFGKTRIGCNLGWYGDFLSIAQTSPSSTNGKGGGGGSISSTNYVYQTAVMLMLCEGPISSVDTAYEGKSQTTLSALGLSLFGGARPQAAWGYLTTYHAGQDLQYNGICYVASGSLQLGSSNSLPNYNFEVTALYPFNPGGGIYDSNPKDIVNYSLTDQNFGALFPSSKLGDLTAYSNYCVALGLFLSPSFDIQKPAHEWIKDIFDMTHSAPFWSEGVLKVVPYGENTITGNGATFTPNVTPIYNLTDDDFLTDGHSDPVLIARTSSADTYNAEQVEFLDRSNMYKLSIAEAKDQSNIEIVGLRRNSVRQYHPVCDVNIAGIIVQLKLQRALYIRNTYQFKLGIKYCLLEPMDVVTITDSALGLNQAQVRITDITENEDRTLSITAEEFPLGIATAAIYQRQGGLGYSVNYNTPAPNTTPQFFSAPGILTDSGYELWVAVTGAGANWGGCDVYASTDNAAYKRVGTIHGGSRFGTLTAAYPAHADPDTADTLSVDLTISKGVLTGGAQADSDNLNLLALIDNEVVSFSNATLTAQYKYDLKNYIRRGVYNSPIAAHSIGGSFVRLDEAVFQYAFPASKIGTTIWFKFLSFNQFESGAQNLAGVSAYSQVLGASVGYPSNVTGFNAQQAKIGVMFTWDQPPDLANGGPNYIAGYELRFNPQGDTNWGDGTLITRVTRGTQLTTVRVPPGNWTFLIKAMDKSGNYSLLPATANLTVNNFNTIVIAKPQAPDWLGTISNFVRHPAGLLIPDTAKIANQLTKQELWEQFVPYPDGTCTYEAPEVDLGADTLVRLHGDIVSYLGRGVVSGSANPQLQADYHTAAGAYLGWQNWTIGYVTCRYFKMRILFYTSVGDAYIQSFTPTADN